MTLRDDLLPTFDGARALIEDFGLRTSTLTVRTLTWPGLPGIGSPNVSDTEITPPPRMRTIAAREIAGSGGRYREGDIRADRITPSYSGGGYEITDVRPEPPEGSEVVYVAGGALAGDYELVDADFSRNFGYSLVLRRKRGTP